MFRSKPLRSSGGITLIRWLKPLSPSSGPNMKPWDPPGVGRDAANGQATQPVSTQYSRTSPRFSLVCLPDIAHKLRRLSRGPWPLVSFMRLFDGSSRLTEAVLEGGPDH